MQTKRGIYYNLKETPYVMAIGKIKFYFSSQFYLNKFYEGYKEYCVDEMSKFNYLYNCKINTLDLFLINYYKKIEKRGFRIILDNEEINKDLNVEMKLM